MEQIGMAWVLNNCIVTAFIVGATKPHHFDEPAAAVDVELTQEEITAFLEDYAVPPAGSF